MMLTGPIEGSGTWETYATSRNIVFTGEDGNKSISIKFKDVAGNISEGPDASATAELDRVFPSLTITMLEDDDVTISDIRLVLLRLFKKININKHFCGFGAMHLRALSLKMPCKQASRAFLLLNPEPYGTNPQKQ